MALETYREKRDFGKTPEPAGVPHPEGGRLYVIQKHAARALHYDFRLELDGVLLSWAIPKGPSMDPHDKHLAVRVEDHPVEYGSFEGVIPKGEYGGGTVELWDRGTWEPESDPHEGLTKGDLKFTLHGEKLCGSWVLARMKRRSEEEGKENWLLIKHRDGCAVDGDGSAILKERPESVVSGRTIEEIAAAADSTWHSDLPASQQTEVRSAEPIVIDPSKLTGAKKVAKMPRFVQPELALLVKEAPVGDAWLHEIKFDGYRAISRVENGRVEMYSRNDKDWTGHFTSVADALATLPVRAAMLDGEVCVADANGRTDFQELQNDLGTGRQDRLTYYVFDLLYLDGYDTTHAPLTERKELLRAVLGRIGSERVKYTDHVRGQGPAFYKQGCAYGVEGIVSKQADSPYRPGVRGKEWLKTKCTLRQEFIVVGWTDPGGSRVGFGALMLGVRDPDGKLRYIGKVGTGFNDKLLTELGARLRAMTVPEPTVERGIERAPKNAHWVRPELVCEVAFAEWTRDGDLRHPSFKGLREDKSPSEVVAEIPKPTEAATAPDSVSSDPRGAGSPAHHTRGASRKEEAKPRVQPTSKKRGADGVVDGVTITHPDRVFWPADNVTKRELVDYYESVADLMLPHVLHRPVSMVRCPEGVKDVRQDFHEHQGPSPCFFHKHAGPDFPGPFERVQIRESEGLNTYLTITERGSLVALAQMGVLEVHIWGCRWPDVERPDAMVFDLDPAPEVGFAQLAEAARLVRRLLDGLGLVSFVKTTGGKGLHVVVPLEPSEDWDVVKRFAKAVADGIVSVDPDRYVSTMAKSKRIGRVFVDYLRNSRTATFIAPYSTRAKEHATVSVPLRWEELGGKARPDTYTVRNLHNRLAHLTGDPWEGYFDVKQTITAKMKRELGIG
jgi:bifunctional non-homologous end joining protein LigD